MKFKTKKYDPPLKIPKSHKWLYVKIIVILIIIACAGYGVYAFFTTYGFRTPIIFQNPIYRIKGNVILLKNINKNKLVVFDVGAIERQIYLHESTSGKNDGCRNMGLYNGYGYRQNSFEHICYSSHEEVRQLVIKWLTTHIKSGDIASALCMYNQGKITSQCSYALKFNYE